MHIKAYQSILGVPHIELSLVADQDDTQASDYRGSLHDLSPGEIIDQVVFCGPDSLTRPKVEDQIRRWKVAYGELEVIW